MKLAILLRGNNFLEKDRYGYSMDARENAASLLEKFLLPIRLKYPETKLYLATYDSPILEELKELIAPCEVVMLDAAGSTQIETFKQGMRHVFENDDCDALLVTRFDLDFKKNFDDWNIQIDDSSVYFPFKETMIGWRDHQRVGDAVHIIGRKAMNDFFSAMIMNQLARRPDLHMLYYFMRTLNGNIRFIEDGHWDSNSMFANPECDNPLYMIFNRPRLETLAPYTGTMPREIRGE
ncbi:hypothetical protein RMR10_001145 [Agrobacterium rosae]|uniref:hypothetical protein n=1 Tax=Agrobacterium rosae TaxID=1972867 RepID=UPI002A12F159|nr:hypothetical protein [Agrobacterium rosae]MDX8314522.1 hypothetical protein [Agrobacterium rosae]